MPTQSRFLFQVFLFFLALVVPSFASDKNSILAWPDERTKAGDLAASLQLESRGDAECMLSLLKLGATMDVRNTYERRQIKYLEAVLGHFYGSVEPSGLETHPGSSALLAMLNSRYTFRVHRPKLRILLMRALRMMNRSLLRLVRTSDDEDIRLVSLVRAANTNADVFNSLSVKDLEVFRRYLSKMKESDSSQHSFGLRMRKNYQSYKKQLINQNARDGKSGDRLVGLAGNLDPNSSLVDDLHSKRDSYARFAARFFLTRGAADLRYEGSPARAVAYVPEMDSNRASWNNTTAWEPRYEKEAIDTTNYVTAEIAIARGIVEEDFDVEIKEERERLIEPVRGIFSELRSPLPKKLVKSQREIFDLLFSRTSDKDLLEVIDATPPLALRYSFFLNKTRLKRVAKKARVEYKDVRDFPTESGFKLASKSGYAFSLYDIAFLLGRDKLGEAILERGDLVQVP